MNKAYAAALVAAVVMGCASVEDAKRAACEAAPTQLVTKDLNVGTGADVVFRTAVLVSYTGWLYDPCAPDHKGAMFDSSEGRVTPFGFVIGAGRVIKGWDEGVIGMKVDGKRLLVIPPDKGYGAAGAGGGKIPPNSTLVFEVILLKIINGPTTPAPAKK